MSSLIQKITKLAVQSFNRDQKISKHKLNVHIEQIKSLVNRITAADLNIDPQLLADYGPFDPLKEGAPVTYMQIYEDADVTICVFILKNGVQLPLHDHPDMNGILKVIHGKVCIQNYTLVEDQESHNSISASTNNSPSFHSAIKHPRLNISADDPACSLAPINENLHEISSVGGSAAFLDILSPPYGHDRRSDFERDCHYYKEVKLPSQQNGENGKALLVTIPTPSDFWCDQAQYTGPSLRNLDGFENGI